MTNNWAYFEKLFEKMSESEIEFDQNLLDYLGQFITPHKKIVMERVLAERTRFIKWFWKIFLNRIMRVKSFLHAIVLEFRTSTLLKKSIHTKSIHTLLAALLSGLIYTNTTKRRVALFRLAFSRQGKKATKSMEPVPRLNQFPFMI